MKKESSYVIESLQRGLYVLSLFNRERSALTLTEIVEATGNSVAVSQVIDYVVEGDMGVILSM